ncbi:MAG: ABC transporter ATP-binding protein [Clostridium sp.]
MSLVAKNLGFYYRKNKWIFKEKDFELKQGEVIGIRGYSGCGKSTFCRILANCMKQREGEVLIDGEESRKNQFQTVQLIYQHPEKAVNPKWRMKKILEESYIPDDDILNRFGIKSEWMDRWPIELSGGELQRFCIVRALNPKTRYIIADEMTTMLDGITQAKIWYELLSVCKERNIGLIVVSHEESLLNRICDKVYSI